MLKLDRMPRGITIWSHRKVAGLVAITVILLMAALIYTPVKAQDAGADVIVMVTGGGKVTSGVGWSDPINCPGDCKGNSMGGGFAQLFATPNAGWSAVGWGGLCSGPRRDLCVANFYKGGSVSMTFELPTPEIGVSGGPAVFPIANGSTTPDPQLGTDIGLANVSGSTVDQTFVIFNTGTGALALTGTPLVRLSGPNAADFTLLSPPATSIASDSFTSFALRFDPSAVGKRSALVTIANNDSNESVYTFTIVGTGYDAITGGPSPVNYTESTGGDLKNDTVYAPCSIGAASEEFILGVGLNQWMGTFGETGNGNNQNDMFRALLPAGAFIDRITYQRGSLPGSIITFAVTDAGSNTLLQGTGPAGIYVYNSPSQNSILNFMYAVDFNTGPITWTVTVNVVGTVQGGSGPLLTFESASPARVTLNEGQSGKACGRFSDRERDAVTFLPGPLTTAPVLTETGPTQTFGDAPANSFGRWEWGVTAVDGPGNSQEVVLRATDNNAAGASSSQLAFQLEVANIAPKVNKPTVAPDPANEIATVTAQATWSDPGVLDVATCKIDYGDGYGPVAGVANFNGGNGTCTGPAHTYADNGTFVISIVVTDKDGGVGSNSYTYVVNNLPPVISSVVNSGPIKLIKSALITVNATDPAGNVDPLTYAFDCNNDSVYEIAPQPQKIASCTFAAVGDRTVNVQVRDDDGGVSTNSTIVQVVPNSPPVANNRSISTNEDTSLQTTVTASDANGDSLTYSIVKGPDHGSLSGTPPTVTYKPNANYAGADSFTFKANDGEVDSNVATVNITVNGVNDAPVANDDSFTINEDTTLSNSVAGNDSDVDRHTITYFLIGNVAHGSLTLNSNGSFTYAPTANYRGADSFTYQANDGLNGTDTATVSITINGVNDAPVANDDSFNTDEETSLSGSVAGNDNDIDGDTLTYSLVSNVSNGSLVLDLDGTFTYTPTTNYQGVDSFTYQANDGELTSNIATVIIVTGEVNDAPLANDDIYTTDEDSPLSNSIAGNDSDSDGDELTYALVTNVNNGTLLLSPDGSFAYTPTTDFNGTDSFTYQADDGKGGIDTAMATITVVPLDEPVDGPVDIPNDGPDDNPDDGPSNEPLPQAHNDAVGTLQGSAVTIDVLANDNDQAKGGLTLTTLGTPAYGSVVIEGNKIVYMPSAEFYGTDTFDYSIRDANGRTDSAQVYVVVSRRDESANSPQIVSVPNNEGGQATFNVGGATIEVTWPATIYTGTVNAEDIVYLVFSPLKSSDFDSKNDAPGVVIGGIMFDLSAYRNGTKLEDVQFTDPIQLTIRYDLGLLGEASAESLSLLYWNGAEWNNSGITLVSQQVEGNEMTLTFDIDHLSGFALFGEEPIALDPTDPPARANQLLLPLVSR